MLKSTDHSRSVFLFGSQHATQADYNRRWLLTGIISQSEPFEQGWWQIHFMLDGKVAHVQWVLVGP